MFFKCRKFGISLNLDKCAFMVFLGTIIGFIISKEGKVMDPKKVEAWVNMPPLLPLGDPRFQWAQFYKCLIKKHCFYYMSPITKLFKKFEIFEWTIRCENAWEEINNQYVQALILINPNWELAVGAIFA